MNIKYIDISSIDYDEFEKFAKFISEKRYQRMRKYYQFGDALRCVIAELLIKYCFYKVTGEISSFEIKSTKYGKLFIKNAINFRFNISHSGKWVVIAYGNNEVGVDIEEIIMGNQEIGTLFFSKAEQKLILSAPENKQDSVFTRIWTMKESFLKYKGTGLSDSLDSFSVDIENGSINTNRNDNKELKIRTYLIDLQYYLSVCSKDEKDILEKIEKEELYLFLNRLKHL